MTRPPRPIEASPQVNYAGFWLRLTAAAIDLFLLWCSVILVLTVAGLMRHSLLERRLEGPLSLALFCVLPACLVIACWQLFNATPGKMLIGARIVDATTGQAPGWLRYAGRYAAYLVSIVPAGLGLFSIGVDRQKRGWHDKLAGTVVIRSGAGAPSNPAQGEALSGKAPKWAYIGLNGVLLLLLWRVMRDDSSNAAEGIFLFFVVVFGLWLCSTAVFALAILLVKLKKNTLRTSAVSSQEDRMDVIDPASAPTESGPPVRKRGRTMFGKSILWGFIAFNCFMFLLLKNLMGHSFQGAGMITGIFAVMVFVAWGCGAAVLGLIALLTTPGND
jgi:uncharacterized RDD family membrane protein YckC